MNIYVIKDGAIWVPAVFTEEHEAVEHMLDKMGPAVKEEIKVLIASGIRIAFEWCKKEKHIAYMTERDGIHYIIFMVSAVMKCVSPNKLKWLATLRHEARHVEQHTSGRLAYTEDGGRTWDGEMWSTERISRKGYVSLPWEVDARKAEIELYKEHDMAVVVVILETINWFTSLRLWWV
jgi:hypothetical protein